MGKEWQQVCNSSFQVSCGEVKLWKISNHLGISAGGETESLCGAVVQQYDLMQALQKTNSSTPVLLLLLKLFKSFLTFNTVTCLKLSLQSLFSIVSC